MNFWRILNLTPCHSEQPMDSPHFAAIGPSHCLHWNAFRYPPEPSIPYAYLPAAFPRMFVVHLSYHPLYGINSELTYFLLQLATTLFASVWVNCEDDKIHQNTLRFIGGQSSFARASLNLLIIGNWYGVRFGNIDSVGDLCGLFQISRDSRARVTLWLARGNRVDSVSLAGQHISGFNIGVGPKIDFFPFCISECMNHGN